ncbi:MAG: glycosyltransferase [Limnochordaceae bacterium]|nr:glycosyltransferase [Limnochordaceae bacterium]
MGAGVERKLVKKRAAIFLHALHGGGVERSFLRLVRAFLDRGIEMDLVLTRAEGPLLSEVEKRARVVDLRRTGALASVPSLAGYLRKERPEAILTGLDHNNMAAVVAKWLAGVPTRTLISAHLPLKYTAYKAPQGAKDRLFPILDRLIYRHADVVVAVSRGIREDLARYAGLDPEAIRVIYNPVVDEDLLASAAVDVNDPWFMDPTPVVLGTGRLEREKGFDTLIKAFALARGDVKARLMILGEGRERGALERLIGRLGLESDVRLPGFVRFPAAYMKRAALFVLPSRYEALPNVLIEALAVGTRVVSTDCEFGPSEVLDGGRYGRLVPVDDPVSLAHAIVEELARKESWDEVERRMRRGREFSVERAAQQYLEVLGWA